jgi:hypothetical protein
MYCPARKPSFQPIPHRPGRKPIRVHYRLRGEWQSRWTDAADLEWLAAFLLFHRLGRVVFVQTINGNEPWPGCVTQFGVFPIPQTKRREQACTCARRRLTF